MISPFSPSGLALGAAASPRQAPGAPSHLYMVPPPAAAEAPREPTPLLGAEDLAFLLAGYRSLLPLAARTEPHLRGVLEDSLAHPGGLLRAQVAFDLQRRRGVAPERARAVAVAIEYFHTASLLFDDLPSMDDATERRGRPCPHLVFGEAATVLAALALITHAYALLWQVIGSLEPAPRAAAGGIVASCLGVAGILDGQARDLHFGDAPRTAEDVLAVAQGKTVSLIRLTLLLPALVAGVSDPDHRRLARLAELWGLAYQIADDFKDSWMSHVETGKSTRRDQILGRPNLPAYAGVDAALGRLGELLAQARGLLAQLSGGRAAWPALEHVQTLLEGERDALLARGAEAIPCANH